MDLEVKDAINERDYRVASTRDIEPTVIVSLILSLAFRAKNSNETDLRMTGSWSSSKNNSALPSLK